MMERGPFTVIDPTATTQGLAPAQTPPRAVLRMIASDRMAGSVPAWLPPETAQEETLSRIETAAGPRSFDDVLNDTLSTYVPRTATPRPLADEPFGFGDIVDMVNPLHHIPVIGHIYRGITGDQIRPASQIIGGAVFGGALGAAGSLANVIVEVETGRDIAGNVIALALPEPEKPDTTMPAQQLAAAMADDPLQTLPGPALSFVALDHKPATQPLRPVWKFNE